jgi:hypothetical protein
MKRLICMCILIAVASGCAMFVPYANIDWTKVNPADTDNLKSGIFTQQAPDVLKACADAIKDEGMTIEKQDDAAGTILTLRQHGVMFYGSMDYAIKVEVKKQAADKTQVIWSTVSYLSKDQANIDPIEAYPKLKWNYLVYKKLVKYDTPVAAVTSPAASAPSGQQVTGTAAPAATPAQSAPEGELPAPPTQ